MNYREAITYIEEIGKSGIVVGLAGIARLCNELSNPQDKLQFIHIAGTNGKGSVLAFLSTILSCAGYRVGRYISPTIFEYRERIQVDGSHIPEEDFCEGLALVRHACNQIVSAGYAHPTAFEVDTALAFWYFAKKKCDIVVLETGMGGLEDATNIVNNTVLAVITEIGMDHMQFLGDTPEKIAVQKAGIIKEGCAVVTAQQPDHVLHVIRETAQAKGCPVVTADARQAKHVSYGLEKQMFDFGEMKRLQITLCGRFQIDNAVLALCGVEQLRKSGMDITDNAIREGLCSTVWPGRFQILGKRPYFIIDGAHNIDAAKRLADTLQFHFTNRRIIYIMGMLKDKECGEVIALTAGLAERIITITPPDNVRALAAEELSRLVRNVTDCDTSSADCIETAVRWALEDAQPEDVIVAFGSLSFLGAMTEMFSFWGKA